MTARGRTAGDTNTWNDSGMSCGTKYVYSVVVSDAPATSSRGDALRHDRRVRCDDDAAAAELAAASTT